MKDDFADSFVVASLPNHVDESGCLNLPHSSEEDFGAFCAFGDFKILELRLSSMLLT